MFITWSHFNVGDRKKTLGGLAMKRYDMAVTPWPKPYKLNNSRARKRYMVVTKTYIAISDDILDSVCKGQAATRIRLRIIDYNDGRALLIAGDPQGFSVHRHNSANKLTLPPRLKQVLDSNNVKPGEYRVEELKTGQYMAVHDG